MIYVERQHLQAQGRKNAHKVIAWEVAVLVHLRERLRAGDAIDLDKVIVTGTARAISIAAAAAFLRISIIKPSSY